MSPPKAGARPGPARTSSLCLRAQPFLGAANHSTNTSVLSSKPLSEKQTCTMSMRGVVCIPPLGFLCTVIPCKLHPELPMTARSVAKAELLHGWSDSKSWSFKRMTTWMSGHCWECQRFPPLPRAAQHPGTSANKPTRDVLDLGIEMEPLMGLGASCCVQDPILSLEDAHCR